MIENGILKPYRYTSQNKEYDLYTINNKKKICRYNFEYEENKIFKKYISEENIVFQVYKDLKTETTIKIDNKQNLIKNCFIPHIPVIGNMYKFKKPYRYGKYIFIQLIKINDPLYTYLTLDQNKLEREVHYNTFKKGIIEFLGHIYIIYKKVKKVKINEVPKYVPKDENPFYMKNENTFENYDELIDDFTNDFDESEA